VLKSKLGLKKIKIGHAGTLDPLATGLMIICTGRETKNIDIYQAGEKQYKATLKLGVTTPSFDMETDPDMEYPVDHISQGLVNEAIDKMKGEILQYPPLYSAKSVDGIRAYKLARKGHITELKPSSVVINSLEIISFEMPIIEIDIVCGKGTYIRSIARDLGQALGSGAYLIKLTRIRSGNFHIKDALNIEDFERNLVLL
jgi:tRNA pseudouridine55 synthase